MFDIKAKTIPEIVKEAKEAAYKATQAHLKQHGDRDACGFAWTNIYKFDGKKIRGNSKLGKLLKANGIEQNYERVFQVWNPSDVPTQAITAKEEGARAYAAVFNKYGFEAYAGSRMD